MHEHIQRQTCTHIHTCTSTAQGMRELSQDSFHPDPRPHALYGSFLLKLLIEVQTKQETLWLIHEDFEKDDLKTYLDSNVHLWPWKPPEKLLDLRYFHCAESWNLKGCSDRYPRAWANTNKQTTKPHQLYLGLSLLTYRCSQMYLGNDQVEHLVVVKILC